MICIIYPHGWKDVDPFVVGLQVPLWGLNNSNAAATTAVVRPPHKRDCYSKGIQDRTCIVSTAAKLLLQAVVPASQNMSAAVMNGTKHGKKKKKGQTYESACKRTILIEILLLPTPKIKSIKMRSFLTRV